MPKHPLTPLLTVIGLACAVLAQDEEPKAPQVPPNTTQTLLVNRVAPIYPPLARQTRIQGTVVLDVIINKAGEVTKLNLISGHPMLAPAAIEAVKQ
jgi:protein TonB